MLRNTGFKHPTYAEALAKKKAKTSKLGAIRHFKAGQKKEDADIVYSSFRKPRVKKPTKKPRSKNQTKKLKAKLWELCKQIIRKRYQTKEGTWHCFTCDRLIDIPAKAQTGHGIPSSTGGILLRYHLDNLRIQDYFCNINLGGNGAEFYRRLIVEIGQEKVDELYKLKQQTQKADSLWLESKIAEYEELLSTP